MLMVPQQYNHAMVNPSVSTYGESFPDVETNSTPSDDKSPSDDKPISERFVWGFLTIGFSSLPNSSV